VQRANVARLVKIAPELSSLKHVIILDDEINGQDRSAASSLGWNLMSWDEFMAKGQQSRVPLCPPKDPRAMYSLCFTSGEFVFTFSHLYLT
jgi:hypothetical protein